MSSTTPILVIGIGNIYRSDDGVGLFVVDKIEKADIEGVKAVNNISDGISLMETWKDAAIVYIIDAVLSGAEPGTVFRFDALSEIIPADIFTGYSTHSFSLVESIKLSRELGNLPTSLVVFGIEGENFSSGVGLSPKVQEAAENTVCRIVDEINNR